jgi:translocation protein SEC66
MAQNTILRERLGEILSKNATEKEWWENRKSAIRTEFMKELDDEKKSEEDAVLVEGGGPAGSVGKGRKGKN